MQQSFLDKFRHAHMPPTQFYRFEYEPDKCTRCKACYRTCPTSCLQWNDEKNQPEATGLASMEVACIGCNNCEAICPAGCIRMRGEYRVLEGRYRTPGDKFGEMRLPNPLGEPGPVDFDKFAPQLTETERVIYRRRSIRLFKDKPVERAMIERILEAGRFAPSAGNGQPLKFLVVTDPKLNKAVDRESARILKLINRFYTGGNERWRKILITLLSLVSASKWDQRPIAAMEKVRRTDGVITFNAPAVIHILKDRRGISHPDIDAAVAAQNIVLAAHALGLGTCYIGFIASTIPYNPKIRKMLGIEYPYTMVTSLCVGYPKIRYDKPVPRGPVPVEWRE